MTDLAGRDHWDAEHARGTKVPDYSGLRPDRVLRDFIADHLRPHSGQRLLELGAGNTAYLPQMARAFGYEVAGLDYSSLGCELARRNLAAFGVEGQIVEADLFVPPPGWEHAFDVVLTMGVAEHFTDTSAAISAFTQYLAPGGRLLTVIPNMRGLPGLATRFVSSELYGRHLPLTPGDLAAAHGRAGLTVQFAGYLVGVNFWVANPGLAPRWRQVAFAPFLAFTRLVWALEDRGLIRLPANRLTSPWVVVVAQSST